MLIFEKLTLKTRVRHYDNFYVNPFISNRRHRLSIIETKKAHCLKEVSSLILVIRDQFNNLCSLQSLIIFVTLFLPMADEDFANVARICLSSLCLSVHPCNLIKKVGCLTMNL